MLIRFFNWRPKFGKLFLVWIESIRKKCWGCRVALGMVPDNACVYTTGRLYIRYNWRITLDLLARRADVLEFIVFECSVDGNDKFSDSKKQVYVFFSLKLVWKINSIYICHKKILYMISIFTRYLYLHGQ